MKRASFFLVPFAFLISSTAISQTSLNQQEPDFSFEDSNRNTTITYQLIPVSNNSWGYDIYIDERLTIHQPIIPGISGNEGFKTQTDAKKVAELVISKMRMGEMPPRISIDELKKLRII